MYSNKIVNFQESKPILNACTKKSGNLLNALRIMAVVLEGWICYQLTMKFDMPLNKETKANKTIFLILHFYCKVFTNTISL